MKNLAAGNAVDKEWSKSQKCAQDVVHEANVLYKQSSLRHIDGPLPTGTFRIGTTFENISEQSGLAWRQRQDDAGGYAVFTERGT